MCEGWILQLYIPDKHIKTCWVCVVDNNADDDSKMNGKQSRMSLVRALITAWQKVSIVLKTFI